MAKHRNLIGKYPWETTENLLKLSFDPAFSTAQKVSKHGVFSAPCFLVFGMNTERYVISLPIQRKCGKIQTRKNFGLFHAEFVFK